MSDNGFTPHRRGWGWPLGFSLGLSTGTLWSREGSRQYQGHGLNIMVMDSTSSPVAILSLFVCLRLLFYSSLYLTRYAVFVPVTQSANWITSHAMPARQEL
jgi:hypothetical protein